MSRKYNHLIAPFSVGRRVMGVEGQEASWPHLHRPARSRDRARIAWELASRRSAMHSRSHRLGNSAKQAHQLRRYDCVRGESMYQNGIHPSKSPTLRLFNRMDRRVPRQGLVVRRTCNHPPLPWLLPHPLYLPRLHQTPTSAYPTASNTTSTSTSVQTATRVYQHLGLLTSASIMAKSDGSITTRR